MFMLVSRRYERASLIVTSNKPFSAWGEIFGDEITAAAMIDRLVHHAEILTLKATATASKTATSHAQRRAKTNPTRGAPVGVGAPPRPPGSAPRRRPPHPNRGCIFNRRKGVRLPPALTPLFADGKRSSPVIPDRLPCRSTRVRSGASPRRARRPRLNRALSSRAGPSLDRPAY
jgi:hypothetical protein